MARAGIISLSGQASMVFDFFFQLQLQNGRGHKRSAISIINSSDDGSHTRKLRRVSQIMFKDELFQSMYGDSLDLGDLDVSLGDLKSQSKRWSKKHGSKIGDRLEKVGPNIEYIQTTFASMLLDPRNLLSQIIESDNIPENSIIYTLLEAFELEVSGAGVKLLRERLISRFHVYLDTYYRGLRDSEKWDADKETVSDHALGNLFLHFLYLECAHAFRKVDHASIGTNEISDRMRMQDIFFGMLRDLGIVPKNVWLRILHEQGLHLGVETMTKEGRKRIMSEGDIDNYLIDPEKESPFIPDSYRLYTDIKGQYEATDNAYIVEVFREFLDNSDFIVIPPGSVANWMPLLNQFGDLIRSSGKPVYMFANALVYLSEPGLLEQIRNVVKMVGRVSIIAPRENPVEVEGYDRLKTAYKEEYKEPVDFDVIQAQLPHGAKMLRVLEYKLYRERDGGLKYDEQDISLILTYLCEFMENRERPDIVKIMELNNIYNDKQRESLQRFSDMLDVTDFIDDIHNETRQSFR